MQFRSIALVATVALSTFAEASPTRIQLETREIQTREPKDGKKTAITGALGALVGLVGMPLTFIFHTANHNPGAKSIASEPSNATDSTNSTSTEVSPPRKHLELRGLQTREPKDGRKTAIAGALGALVGLVGMPLTFMFHTANHNPGAKAVAPEPPKAADPAASTACLNPKLAPVAVTTRDLETVAAPPAIGGTTAKLYGVGAGLGLLGAAVGSALPFIFTRPGPKPVPAPAPAPAEVNATTDCSPKPKASSAPLVARAFNKEKLGAGAAGVGLITAIASSIFPFIFTRPGPKPKSIESLDNSNSSLATDEATFTLSAFRNNVSIAEAISFPHTLNLGVPASLALDCGHIAVTLRQFEAFTCDFQLPSNMPNATLTGENPGQSLSFEVAGDCIGVEFKVTNDCVDCPTPLNVDCQGNVDGTDNEVALCATGSTLAKC